MIQKTNQTMKEATIEQIQERIKFLETGDVFLSHARKLESGKVQLELLEVINLNVSPLGLFNRSDERFSSNKPTRAWLTAEAPDVEAALGVNLDMIEVKEMVKSNGNTIEVYPLGIKNPIAKDGNMRYSMRVEITEGTDVNEVFSSESSREWALDNPEMKAKRDYEGNFLLRDGDPIFRETTVVFDTPSHTLCRHNSKTPSLRSSSSFDVTAGISEEESEKAEVISVM